MAKKGASLGCFQADTFFRFSFYGLEWELHPVEKDTQFLGCVVGGHPRHTPKIGYILSSYCII